IVVLIELPHVTEILGMRLADTLQPWKTQGNAVTHWGGNLHGYQIIDGLPCKGGPYVNDKSGGVLFDGTGKFIDSRSVRRTSYSVRSCHQTRRSGAAMRKNPGASFYPRPAPTYQYWKRGPRLGSRWT